MTTQTTMEDQLAGASVSEEVFKLRPDYRALLLAIEGISPGPSNEQSETMLQEAETSAKALLAQKPVTELPHIVAWREAYKAFGTKPAKNKNSLEALTRRVEAGLPRVNRLTDIYNAISVKHQIPFGGEDLDKYSGSPFLIRATGEETFETTASGEKIIEHPNKGEVVWCDSEGVTCRHWNWRQTPRTALSDGTTKVLFIMDALGPVPNGALEAAAEELVSALKKFSPQLRVIKRLLTKAV